MSVIETEMGTLHRRQAIDDMTAAVRMTATTMTEMIDDDGAKVVAVKLIVSVNLAGVPGGRPRTDRPGIQLDTSPVY